MSIHLAQRNYYKAPCSSRSLQKWLKNTENFDLHYGGYLFNHLAHPLIVIGNINLPDDIAEEKLYYWTEKYLKHSINNAKIQPARPYTSDMPIITEDNWKEYICNSHTNFPSYLQYFTYRINTSGVVKTLNEYIPSLLPGLLGSAVHPTIHLGLGLESSLEAEGEGSSLIVSQALACMCTNYLPIAVPHPQSLYQTLTTTPSEDKNTLIFDNLLRYMEIIKDANIFSQLLHAISQPHLASLPIGTFQRKIFCFRDCSGDDMFGEYINNFSVLNFYTEDKNAASCIRELQALTTCLLIAYDNEFFVIHLVTSLHSLIVVIQYMESEDYIRTAITHWYRAMLAIVAAENVSSVNIPQFAEMIHQWRVAETAASQVNIPSDTDDGKSLNPEEEDYWNRALDFSLSSSDEHVPKVVYAMWRWSLFADTKQHSALLYKQAVNNILKDNSKGTPDGNIRFTSSR